MNKKLIFFDFDGVLVDTLDVGWTINKEVKKDMSLEEYKNLFNINVHDSARDIHHPNRYERYDFYTRELKVPPILQ